MGKSEPTNDITMAIMISANKNFLTTDDMVDA